jgi:hypothetical protein
VSRKNTLSAVAFATTLALALPGQADAQTCAGYPAMPGALAAGASFASPPGGTSLGVEASYNYAGPMGSFAHFNLVTPEGDGERASIIGAGVSYDIAGFVPAIPTWLSTCPLAAVSVTRVDGTTEFTIPVGVGFGMTIPLVADAIDIMPFAIPQFVLTRLSVEGATVRDHNFGIGFGALARFANIYAGVTANRDFVEAAEIDLSIRAGLTIPIQ